MTVTVAGVDVSGKVERMRTRLGRDMPIMQCELDMPLDMAYPVGYETLVVQAGLTNDLHHDTTGPSTTRFNGILLNEQAQHWPYTRKPQGFGWLKLADKFEAPVDKWGDYLSPVTNPDPFAVPSKYDPPGYDLTNSGAGQTDVQQITTVLTAAGLAGKIGTLLGLPYLLGTQVKAFEQFVWRRGQSALQYVESVDAMYGFRTTEYPDGTINRSLTTNLVPQFSTVQYTLNENVDVLEGASISWDADNVRNRIEQQGWDPGDGTNLIAVFGGASPLPPGIALVSETFSSSLIERYLMTDAGGGMSVEEAANFWLGQLQYPMLECVVPTWRDDPFKPGDIVYLNCPHLLGVNQAMTLKHLECEVTTSTFTQYLTLRAQDYSVYRGPPVLPFQLG